MLTIPSITTAIMIRKCRLEAFQRHVRAAHNCLTHVIKAVDHVPVVVLFELVAGCHAAVDGNDGVQAVKLVRHGGSEDGIVGPDDGGGEIVVVLGVRDGLETHADCNVLVFGELAVD